MSLKNPKVSIGLPVYNGENFLQEAIDSILAQTFKEFELIISDNTSTDNTEAICRAYVAQDRRIRYYRNQENVGASGNYIRVFNLATGEYFKWAAHDDLCQPEFLVRCVEVLDYDPEVILCYARTASINSQGQLIKEWVARPELTSPLPYVRLRDVLVRRETFSIWDVMRTDILAKTPLLGNYSEHDRPLLAELSLYGQFHEIPEFLFLDREHQQRSIRAYDASNPYEAVVWYDPKMAGKITFPAWRLLVEYIAGLNRAPLSWSTRVRCYLEVARWFKHHKQELVRDLIIAAEHMPFGPMITKTRQKQTELSWTRDADLAVKELTPIIDSNETFILVDEATLDPQTFSRWQTIPFLERNGQYWGLPSGDNDAIQELERLRQSGAKFIVFLWPTFWWFDHYTEFFRYLHSRFNCLLKTDRLLVFDLSL